MKVKVILDGLFTKKNGLPASYNMDKKFFERYLSVFDSVRVVARCENREDKHSNIVVDENITFSELPFYRGPAQFIKVLPKFIFKFTKEFAKNDSVYILRLPATVPMILGFLCIILGRKFAVELVGDPEDAYSSESLNIKRANIFKAVFVNGTRILCTRAIACSYVTKIALQKKYPNKNMFNYTSLSLPDEYFNSKVIFKKDKEKVNILMVAVMQNYYKGHDLAIEAISKIYNSGNKNIYLSFVGDGPLESTFKELVSKLGLDSNIKFLGRVSGGKAILDLMKQYDLLLLPSRQEGLPRVIIEAMSQGLPCIANDVGGTSEMLSGDQLIKGGINVDVLADRIMHFYGKQSEYYSRAEANITIAQEYKLSSVELSRKSFYTFLKNKHANIS